MTGVKQFQSIYITDEIRNTPCIGILLVHPRLHLNSLDTYAKPRLLKTERELTAETTQKLVFCSFRGTVKNLNTEGLIQSQH